MTHSENQLVEHTDKKKPKQTNCVTNSYHGDGNHSTSSPPPRMNDSMEDRLMKGGRKI